jgi:uncharacterized protein YndB with AHSA1/START domain
MSERPVEHATFAVERRYEQPSDRVFAAWADREAKARWWGRSIKEHDLDFRVGGRERQRGIDEHGNAYTFEAHYRDILPGERIVYSYEMLVDETRISVSLATVEFVPEGSGTRLIYTEQGAFLDEHDWPARREHGMGGLLDALGAVLADAAI